MRSSKTRLVAAAALTAFVAVMGLAGAAAAITMKSTMNSALGSSIVVSASGRTLYHDSAEAKNTVKCVGTCAAQWRPLLISSGAKPVAGTGVTAAKVGIVKRPDGKVQVTYAGLPLYLFAGDSKAGDVNGQGVGGIWHAIAPSGVVITKTVKTSSSTSGKTSSSTGKTGGSSSGGGYSPPSSGGGGTGGGGTGVDCNMDPNGYGCM